MSNEPKHAPQASTLEEAQQLIDELWLLVVQQARQIEELNVPSMKSVSVALPAAEMPQIDHRIGQGFERVVQRAEAFEAQQIEFITRVRKNMKPVERSPFDHALLRRRSLVETVETVFDELKNLCQVEHTHHRINRVCPWP